MTSERPPQTTSFLPANYQRFLRQAGSSGQDHLRRFNRRLREASLPATAALASLGMLLLAFVVLYLSQRPWLNGWTADLDTEPMKWKDRLALAQVVTVAVAIAIALVVLYRKQRDAEEARFTTLFAEAAIPLGSNSPAVRIATVYAIAALADRYSKHRQQCIDALCGYLRLPYNPEAGRGHLTSRTEEHPGGQDEPGVKTTTTHTFRPEDREVRLTILRIIRDHLRDPVSPTTWCGHDLDFTGVVFDGGDFDGAHFTGGKVLFNLAQFTGGEVTFVGAQFSGGEVSFVGAQFTGGTVTFSLAQFNGGTVTFSLAHFIGGEVTFSLAQFAGGTVSFNLAQFNGGTVTFSLAHFIGGEVTFDLAHVTAGEVTFIGAQFTNGTVTFSRTQFTGGVVTFSRALFTDATVNFDGAQFGDGDVVRDGQPFRGHPLPGSRRSLMAVAGRSR